MSEIWMNYARRQKIRDTCNENKQCNSRPCLLLDFFVCQFNAISRSIFSLIRTTNRIRDLKSQVHDTVSVYKERFMNEPNLFRETHEYTVISTIYQKIIVSIYFPTLKIIVPSSLSYYRFQTVKRFFRFVFIFSKMRLFVLVLAIVLITCHASSVVEMYRKCNNDFCLFDLKDLKSNRFIQKLFAFFLPPPPN